MTHDADASNPVMQPFEGRALELRKACRNEPAQPCQHSIEPLMESDVQTVRKQMSAAKDSRVSNQLVDRETNRSIIGGDNGARAGAHDDVDGDVVSDQPLQDAEVTGAAQTSPAEDKADTNWRLRMIHAEAAARRRLFRVSAGRRAAALRAAGDRRCAALSA